MRRLEHLDQVMQGSTCSLPVTRHQVTSPITVMPKFPDINHAHHEKLRLSRQHQHRHYLHRNDHQQHYNSINMH